jgi:hypothetical protein
MTGFPSDSFISIAPAVTRKMSNSTQDNDHLHDLEDGAGCTEIWEKLSEQRDAAAQTADTAQDD